MSRTSDVVVVGGGVIGCGIAWRLAERGVTVRVVERATPGSEATWAAGGMLSPLAEADRPGPFLDLALASLERFPDFVEAVEAASGIDVDYDRTHGKLHVAMNDGELGALRHRLEWQRAGGFDVALLDGDEARRIEPALAPSVAGALHLLLDHRVDNRLLGRALWLAATSAGARVDCGATVTSVTPGPSGVTIGMGDGGTTSATTVVIAAGAWSGTLRGLPRKLPVFPVRGQMVAVERVPPLLQHVVETSACYLIPRSTGRVVVGATQEREGFRRDVTAGAVRALLAGASAVAPELAGATFSEAWSGFRPGTPDDLPILGHDPEAPAVVYATGHFRNGILLTPVTAETIADLVCGEAPAVDLHPFAPDRFSDER